MARHGRGPFGPYRRCLEAGDYVNGEALELAVADPPFGPVDLGADGVGRTLPALRDRRLEPTARGERAHALGLFWIAGKKLAVRTDQRVKAAGAAPDQRVELLEILRQHGDCDHAVETFIQGRTAPGQNEKWRAEGLQPGLHDFAHIGADIAGHVHVEESPLARAQVARDLYELTGEERPPLPVDEKDRAQLWQCVDDPL